VPKGYFLNHLRKETLSFKESYLQTKLVLG
jgi:hypothetical protein